VYLKTALLLGGLGTVAGVVLGAVLAYVLARFFGSTFFAVGVGFGIAGPSCSSARWWGCSGRRWPRWKRLVPQSAAGTPASGCCARPLPAPPGADRAAQRRPAPAAQLVHVAGDRAGHRHRTRGARPCHRGRQHQPWLVGDHGEDVKIDAVGRHPLDARAAALIRATPGVATCRLRRSTGERAARASP